MENINDLQTRITNLENETNSLITDKEFNIEQFIKTNYKYIYIYISSLSFLIILKPFFIKSKVLVKGSVVHETDYSKVLIWSILLTCITIYILKKKKIYLN